MAPSSVKQGSGGSGHQELLGRGGSGVRQETQGASNRSWGEFTSVEFGEHCARRGVQRQLTAPYTPQQNGVVERRNQTVVGMARSILKAKALPSFFWGEAVHTAVHLLNRAPMRALDGKTPFES